MSFRHPLPTALKMLLGLAMLVLSNGCAEKPVGPVFNLYGYQRIAVVPFDNNTQDPALASALQDEMTSEVVNLNAVPVIDAGQVAVYLKAIQAKSSDVPTDPELRQKISQHFKCDILLIGSAEGYNEFLKDEAPKRSDSGWGFYTDRKVVIYVSTKLMDPTSGGLLWARNKSWGSSWHNTWNPLPVPASVMIPDQIGQFIDLANLVSNRINHKVDVEPLAIDENSGGGLIYLKSQAFAGLRNTAINEAVGSLVRDFRGQGNWTPALRNNNQ